MSSGPGGSPNTLRKSASDLEGRCSEVGVRPVRKSASDPGACLRAARTPAVLRSASDPGSCLNAARRSGSDTVVCFRELRKSASHPAARAHTKDIEHGMKKTGWRSQLRAGTGLSTCASCDARSFSASPHLLRCDIPFLAVSLFCSSS